MRRLTRSHASFLLLSVSLITGCCAPRGSRPVDEVVTRAEALLETQAAHPGLGDPTVHVLAPGVYAVTGLYHSRGPLASVNAGIIFAGSSVVFIDSGMTVTSGLFLWNLAGPRVSGGGQIFLVLTHHHSDHVFGMRVFKERGATVIAHRLVGEELKGDDGFYKSFVAKLQGWTSEEAEAILGDVRLSAPDRTIEGDYVLDLDGDEIHLLATPGHVPDEIVVYHPKSRTLFAGDAVYASRPPNTRFGGPEEWETWIRHLERIRRLDIETIVPGHGEVSPKSLIDQNIDYLKRVLEKGGHMDPVDS